MIVGVGIDVVPVARFAQAMARTPSMASRLFTPAELLTGHGEPRTAESLAARFAAKEALAKALGAPSGMSWQDAEIRTDASGRPWFAITGTVAQRARELGIGTIYVSLSHDAGIASAVVVCEA